VKAIPQVLDGIKYRSRTEARWSRFFDLAGMDYEYESEGYMLEVGWYVPDFWLSESGVYFEVKGTLPNGREVAVAQALARHRGVPVVVAMGNPSPRVALRVFMPDSAAWNATLVEEFKGSGAWIAQFADGGGEAIAMHRGLKNCSATGDTHPMLKKAGRLQFRAPTNAEPDPNSSAVSVGMLASQIVANFAKKNRV